MITLKQGKEQGQWSKTTDGEVVVRCPGCGQIGFLDDHDDIEADGKVMPSLACPKDCGFHEFVILEGYTK